MLTEIAVKRFKAIQEVSLPLDRINILIGANNSGKSSILQAVQFAVSVAQSVKLLGAEWRKDEVKLSFAPTQLIYSPMRDIAALARNRNFTEYAHSAIQVDFVEIKTPVTPVVDDAPVETAKSSSSIRVIRGRGQNIQCTVFGSDLGRRLQPTREPFSVFVPGLAGIPNFEEQKAAATVRRAAARGDANNVFRNVLLLLKGIRLQWQQFHADFQRVFPDLNIDVTFNTDQDEQINATIVSKFGILPIDAAGTGVLQTIQILAYINLSKPKLLILDEPDAHLHPNNQRRLAELLIDISEARDFQILLSTHSRHLVDAFRSSARMHWIRNGKRVPDEEYDELQVLMDVGALDRGDLLKSGKIKCVVLTEDDDVEAIALLLSASGFKMEETDIWSYKGCAKLNAAVALYAFITSHAPAVKVVIHRDRDYLNEDEVASYQKALESECKNVSLFITEGTDTESHFLVPDHICAVFPTIGRDRVDTLLERATQAAADYSIEKFINARSDIEGPKERKLGGQLNSGALALLCQKDYGNDPRRFRHGKRVLKQFKNIAQSELKLSTTPLVTSQYLKVLGLAQIAERVWPVDPIQI